MWSNITYRLVTPDGPAIITIVENPEKPNGIENIFFMIGKAGSATNSYCDALARMVMFALKTHTITEVINELSSITADKPPIVDNGKLIRSGVEALFIALLNWRNDAQSPYALEDNLYTPPYLNVDVLTRI